MFIDVQPHILREHLIIRKTSARHNHKLNIMGCLLLFCQRKSTHFMPMLCRSMRAKWKKVATHTHVVGNYRSSSCCASNIGLRQIDLLYSWGKKYSVTDVFLEGFFGRRFPTHFDRRLVCFLNPKTWYIKLQKFYFLFNILSILAVLIQNGPFRKLYLEHRQ